MRMSQNIRAVAGVSPRHGRIWNVDGSGLASMSDSCTRAKPSIADPSKPMPSLNAPSSSAGAMATDFSEPSTSVNHSRTKRTSRSSSARSTKSSCLPMALSLARRLLRKCFAAHPTRYAGCVPQLRLALAQVNARVGDLAGNAELVVDSCRDAPPTRRPPGRASRRWCSPATRSRTSRCGRPSSPRRAQAADELADATRRTRARRPRRHGRLPRPGRSGVADEARHAQERAHELRRGHARRRDRRPAGQAPPAGTTASATRSATSCRATRSTSSRSAASTSRSRSARTSGATARRLPPRPPRPALLVVLNGSPYEARQGRRTARAVRAPRPRGRVRAGLRQPGRRPGRAGLRRRLDRRRRRAASSWPAPPSSSPELLVVDLDLPAATAAMPDADTRFERPARASAR